MTWKTATVLTCGVLLATAGGLWWALGRAETGAVVVDYFVLDQSPEGLDELAMATVRAVKGKELRALESEPEVTRQAAIDRMKAQALTLLRQVDFRMELHGDGRFASISRLGPDEVRTDGRWSLEGETLTLHRQAVDGEPIPGKAPTHALWKGDTIRITVGGNTLTLRRAP
ncbi:MAG: hypothetical protein P1V36_10110 [Planctomycetota bacterium]|nr:hypothetical protein [Planctomycetota bacterium]